MGLEVSVKGYRTWTHFRSLSLCAALRRCWGVILGDTETHIPTQLSLVDLYSRRLVAL